MQSDDRKRAQFSLRSLFVVILAVSLVMAVWRATGSVVVLLLGTQALCAWIMYLDFRVSPDEFNCTTGCSAIMALMLLSVVFIPTLLLMFSLWTWPF